MSAIVLDHPRRRASDYASDPVLIGRTRRVITVAVVSTLAMLVALVAVLVLRARSDAEDRLLTEIRESGSVAARVVVAPLLTEQWHDGVPAAVESLELQVAGLRAVDGVAQVAVSTLGGTVLWSTEPDLVGGSALMPAQLSSRDQWVTRRGADDASAGGAELIDVHTVVESTTGEELVATISYPKSELDDLVDAWWSGLLPLAATGTAAFGALVLTPAVVVPRRTLRQRRERELMLERIISTSDLERRRIASEVHDGAVQDLVGVTFGLNSLANSVADTALREQVDELADTARSTVTSLRSLLNSIYPVRVPDAGWVHGIDDLLEALRALGVRVDVEAPERRHSELGELLMLRVAREALRNVAAHSGATNVRISVVDGRSGALLTIADDGRGFDPATAKSARRNGHFGLQLIRDLACEMGAALTISSQPGRGAVVRLDIGGELSKERS